LRRLTAFVGSPDIVPVPVPVPDDPWIARKAFGARTETHRVTGHATIPDERGAFSGTGTGTGTNDDHAS